MKMMLSEYSAKIHEKSIREESERKGRAEGRADGITEMVKNFLAVGTPIEYIQKASGWTEDQILAMRRD